MGRFRGTIHDWHDKRNIMGRRKSRRGVLLVIIFCFVNSRLKRSDRFFRNVIASPIAEEKSEPVELPIEL